MTDLEKAILDSNLSGGGPAVTKRPRSAEKFDWTPIRYAQKVNALLDEPEAVYYSPHL